MHFGSSEEHAEHDGRKFVSGIARISLRRAREIQSIGESSALNEREVYLFGFRRRNPSGGTVRLSDHS